MPPNNQNEGGAGDSTPVSVNVQLSNAKNLLPFLKSLQFHGDLCVTISANGIKLTTEDSKVFQANAFLQGELFRKFDIAPAFAPSEEIAFEMDLGALVDCISMFGNSASSEPALCLR